MSISACSLSIYCKHELQLFHPLSLKKYCRRNTSLTHRWWKKCLTASAFVVTLQFPLGPIHNAVLMHSKKNFSECCRNAHAVSFILNATSMHWWAMHQDPRALLCCALHLNKGHVCFFVCAFKYNFAPLNGSLSKCLSSAPLPSSSLCNSAHSLQPLQKEVPKLCLTPTAHVCCLTQLFLWLQSHSSEWLRAAINKGWPKELTGWTRPYSQEFRNGAKVSLVNGCHSRCWGNNYRTTITNS